MKGPDFQEPAIERRSIRDIEPIEESRNRLITNRSELRNFVEEPLLAACQELWDKNIQTLSSSANRKDLEHGQKAHIIINFGELSPENQEIARGIGEPQEYDGTQALKIEIPFGVDTTAEELGQRAMEITGRFKSQKATWIKPETLEGMKKIYGIDPEDDVSPESFIEPGGFFYEEEKKLFWPSEELFKKATEASVPAAEEGVEKKKRDYFERVAFRYLPQMRLMFRGGKLWSKDKWRNVAEHCLAGVVAAEVLADSLGLSEEDKSKLLKTTACHDWDKRKEKFPDQFDPEEKVLVDRLLEAAELDKNFLKRSLGPWANGREGELSFLENLQRYIDNLLQGSEIVNPEKRLHELAKRRGDLSKDPEFDGYEGDLAGFWDREIANASKTEEEIFAILKEKGFKISSPGEVSEFVKEQISQRIAAGK